VLSATVMGLAMLALLPFLLPYDNVSQAYGFVWGRDVVEKNSPTIMHWLMAEYRNKLWKGFGDNVPGGNYRLFPGLLPLVLALGSVLLPGSIKRNPAAAVEPNRRTRWLPILDVVAILAGIA